MKTLDESSRKALLYFHTVRQLRPVQIFARAAHVGRFRLYRSAPGLAARLFPEPTDDACHRAGSILARSSEFLPGPGVDDAIRRAEACVQGRVAWQGVPGVFKVPVDWHATAFPKLWRYHLHYQDVVVDLGIAFRATQQTEFFDVFRDLADDWTSRNPPGLGDGWEPYPLATRIVNWIVAQDLFQGADSLFDARLSRSIARQASFLAQHLEWHLLGNHLWRNLVATCIAAAAFQGKVWDDLRRRSLSLLERQVREQVPEDGLHFELAPSYHVLALDDLLKVAAALQNRGHIVPQWLAAAISRMVAALRTILAPDGTLPALNDTTAEQTAIATDILDEDSLRHRLWGSARWVSKTEVGGAGNRPPGLCVSLGSAGLYVGRAADEFVIFDAGSLGPSYLPGHAHSDTLGFELSHAGRPVFVDSGISSYEAGVERDYCRSALAHNVVTVDLEGPDELWAAFRVARRSRVVASEMTERDGLVHVSAEIEAVQGWRHRRDFFWDPRAGVASFDRVEGVESGRAIRSHLHLHPSLDANVEGRTVRAGDVRITALRGGPWSIHRGEAGPPRRGWHAAALGKSQPAVELALDAEAGEPAVAAWAASWSPEWDARAAALLQSVSR